ncbi:MAG TPA: endopeptidase La [Candidatus Hydrogenedentes bacterium]|nr:endopeptidase La [Candidatus Hydrogenedentota bacterium]
MSENGEPKHLPAQTGMDFPDSLPLLMLSGQVVFPMALVPFRLTTKEERLLIEDSIKGHRLLALVALRGPESENRQLSDAYEIGCIARILQMQPTPDGKLEVVTQSLHRFRVTGLIRRDPYFVVRAKPLEDVVSDAEALEPLARTVKTQMTTLIQLHPAIPDGAQNIIENIDNPSFLADLVASNLSFPVEEKQKLLETLDVKKRLMRLMHLLEHEIELLKASSKIHQEVKDSIEKGQREYFLRQQMKAIQDELGIGEGQRAEAEEYRKKVEAAKFPEEVKKEALREVDRLARMHEASGEYSVVITYLDILLELPWNKSTEDRLDIQNAEIILNEDHYGLEKVKRRILEYLAVRKLKPDAHGPILCFQGPPGVGKTSLGKSIARALGRSFVRMALGGLHDEAEIRGHRKTYVGAMPGRIIQGIRKAGSNNPVFMLDEIDKVGNDFRGDPSSALLEVLDPAQNNSFMDNYLNVSFDLSKVMFIATANVLDTIPWALRDRMEIIEIPGYTLDEKLHIARKYLVPRQLDEHGLIKDKLRIDLSALRAITAGYTREAGVRNLEREIAHVCRGCARKFASGRRTPLKIAPKDLREYLGNPKVFYDTAERTRMPGVVIGLAWTAVGGDILFIEATRMPGKGNLILTGQLGDVMKESAQAALSFLRANAEKLSIEPKTFSEFDIHVHVPAGAVPKDGPSAGVTMLTAIASLLTKKRVKGNLAMTGEITLRGNVLPVGGIKEKVLAAARAGIRQLILPERCKHDLDEIPASVRKKLKVHFVSRMNDVLRIALGIQL